MPYGNITYSKKFNYNKRFNFNNDLPLDIYKNNLVMGFSYYKLLSNYNGYCVKIRRSSDNALLDVGFTNDYIDIDSILSFVGSDSAYVYTWYNQYSLGNNAIQISNSLQPQIFNSGSFYSNGIYFNGIENLLNVGSINNIAKSIYVNFYNNVSISYMSTGITVVNISGTYGGLRFGSVTGLLTNELVSIVNNDVSSRSGWCTTAESLTQDTYKILSYFDNTKYNITINNSIKPITYVGTPTNLTMDNVSIAYDQVYNTYLNANIKTIVITNSIADYKIVSKV